VRPSAVGPLRSFANWCRVPSMCLLQGSKAWPPGSQSCRGLACSASMDRAGRDRRVGDSAHVLRAGLRPSLPLDFAASPARRSRQAVDREGRESPLAQRIGSARRVAQRSEGGDVGRRPASGDMSAAARPAGPIPPLSTLESGPRNRRSRTTATGRQQTDESRQRTSVRPTVPGRPVPATAPMSARRTALPSGRPVQSTPTWPGAPSSAGCLRHSRAGGSRRRRRTVSSAM